MMNDTKCPVCKSEMEVFPRVQDGEDINCSKCGKFFILGSALSFFMYDDVKIHLPKISSWISEQNKIFGIKRPSIGTDTLEIIINQKEKTIKEKFDCFMNTIKTLQNGQIQAQQFNYCYIYDDIELGRFFQKALEKNYIKGNSHQLIGTIPMLMYSGITFDGLEYIESLYQTNKNSKNVFCAFYFTEKMQNIFDNDIKQTLDNLGLAYVRVSSSTTDTNTTINDDIIGKIKSSKIVIVDFTGQRNSVYFEAGLAMGLKIPVIWTCKKDEVEKLSFDTRQYPHILWDTKEELASKIQARIKTLL